MNFMRRHLFFDSSVHFVLRPVVRVTLPTCGIRRRSRFGCPGANLRSEAGSIEWRYLVAGLPVALCLAVLVSAFQPARAAGHGWVYADKVIVFKARRQLQLRSDGQVLKTFRISLGRDPTGPKRREGDMRTPEGHYILDWKNPYSLYYLSIHISYPNAHDRARASRLGVDPGEEIMIHGLPNHPEKSDSWYRHHDWTFGCIAVSDAAMQWIWMSVKPGTPVVIKP